MQLAPSLRSYKSRLSQSSIPCALGYETKRRRGLLQAQAENARIYCSTVIAGLVICLTPTFHSQDSKTTKSLVWLICLQKRLSPANSQQLGFMKWETMVRARKRLADTCYNLRHGTFSYFNHL